MSYIHSNVPIIAITPDEGPNTDNDVYNIDEVATDVEDIYFQTEKRKKKIKKHTPKKDVYATDIEDLDGSDDDLSSPLIKHASPISIDQVLIEADVPTVEENFKIGDSNSRIKPKLQTQASVTSNTQYLQPDEVELNQVVTDLEDFNDSDDDDEVTEHEPSDTDLLKEIIFDSGTVAISDSVKKFLQAVPSPMVTPVGEISDDDEENQRKRTKKSGKTKGYKQHIDPLSMCTNLNELTDIETLNCDSNDETKQKPKHSKVRRHTLSRKLKLDTTDSEDLDVSENEEVKNRRVTVTEIPKIGLKQFSFENTDAEIYNSLINIPQILNDGDSDTEGIPMYKNLKYSKHSNQLLQINKKENNATTDIEDMDAESDIDEGKTNDEIEDNNFILDLDSNCGVVEEKSSTKKNNIYKVEKLIVRQEKNKNWNSTENETDEEDQCDLEMNKAEICSPNVENVDLKFITRNTKGNSKKFHRKYFNDNKNSLYLPTVENADVLTDVENLNSSDDDDDIDEIPVTVVNNMFNVCLTDTESVDGELENEVFDDDNIPDTLPSCSRKLIYEKVNENNGCEIVSSILPDSEDAIETTNLGNETDTEELSGEELIYEIVNDNKFVIELDVADNNTEYKDTLKLPGKAKSDDEETDIEDISEVKQKSRKYSQYLYATQDEADKYTDVEDLSLSDTENSKKTRNSQVVGNKTADKTDVEDFYASDNDNDRVSREYTRTPDILRQMGGETICSQEGSGYFTQQDRKRLNEKHNITNLMETSPSPTNTDEFVTSADDDYYSRAETATPLQMRQELDEASSFKVHNQTTKKLDLDADDEVMYLKGGGFLQDGYTDTEELGVSEEEYYLANDKMYVSNNQQKINVSAELRNKEWGPTKPIPADKPSQEVVSAEDAAPQDSGAVRMDNNNGNQRTLGASCSKLKSYFTPNFSQLNTPVSSYTHLDKILDHMLAEVDEQEKLVHLDSSQNFLKPVCVNSLQLVPSTDAIIEIPVSHFSKLYETKHEILLSGDSHEFGIETTDLDDEISLTTMNGSQDSESLFSFESLSELYFLESISNKNKASCESLNDLEYVHMHAHSTDDDHVYEIIEPKENYSEITHESYDNQQDIWWEGTYRDLSIVPEEDEDNISEISKNIIQSKQELPLTLTQFNETNYENVSVQSSSDTSQTTGDEYESSDIEHTVSSKRPVKAEIKLLVKTLDKGKEDVEIRSVRDFANQVKTENTSNKSVLNTLTNTFPRRERLGDSKSRIKPTFTLQRLFIRSPESTGFVTTKELSKSNPELVATSNIQYPLQYDPKMTNLDYFKNIQQPSVDLYANTPFYPCYGSYMKTENIKVNPSKTQSFPTAYCDWLLQPDDPNGGKTTSPSKQFVSIEVTGDSIINDVLSKDIKPVIDQTKMFIRMESQPETSNVCVVTDATTPSQKVKSPDQDKASKELDNKKEKSKGSKGFFSSLKSLVGRSLDSSDSESKEEKTPKKKKKEKGAAKKGKKSKEEQSSPKLPGKSKDLSPKLERRPKALYESQELDNIPSIDEIESNGMQVTDLDAEPFANDEVKSKATAIVDNVINDSQKAASKMLEGKIQEFNLEGTVTPEEVRRSAEPIIINEDEFLVVIEPNNYNQKTDNKYENIQKSVIKESESKKINMEKLPDKSDDEEKSDTLKRKSVGFLKLFGKKDSKESDDESRADEQKQTISKIDDKIDQKSEEHRKSSGFFGLFSKKSSKEDEPNIEEKDDIKKEEQGITDLSDKIEFSKQVQKQMIETADFLLKEVELFDDVRPNYEQILKTKDINLPNAELGHDAPSTTIISKEVPQQMIDTTCVPMKEIELFEHVRPKKVIKEKVCVQEETLPSETGAKIETNHLILSGEVQQQIVDTADFLLTEVQNFEDVRLIRAPQTEQNVNIRREFAELQETQPITISEEVQQQIVDSANFLYTEVELFEDVRPQVITHVEDKDEINIDSNISTNISSPSEQKEDNKDALFTKPLEQVTKESEHSESRSGFFSKLGEKFSNKSVDKKDEPKERKVKKKKEKKPGFFSKIGERFSTLSDDEKEIKDSVKSTKENIEKKSQKIENKLKIDSKIPDNAENKEIEPKIQIATDITNIQDKTSDTIKAPMISIKDISKNVTDNTVTFINNIGEEIQRTESHIIKSVNDNDDDNTNMTTESFTNIKETLQDSVGQTDAFINVKGQDAKATTIDARDKTDDKIKESISDSKDVAEDSAEKIEKPISHLGDKIKDTTLDTTESAGQIVKDTVFDVRYTASDTADKTKDAISDTEGSVLSAGYKVAEKVKSTGLDTKESAKEVVEKTGGFFSGLGKKIKGTAKDTKEEVISKAKTGKEKLEDATIDTKDALKDSAEKTSDKIKDSAEAALDTLIETKDKTTEKLKESLLGTEEAINVTAEKYGTEMSDVGGKVKDTVCDAGDTAKDTADKTGTVISQTGDKIKEIANDTKDSVISAGDKAAVKVKDTTSDTKEAAKDVVEKTGGFFSGLGKKIKGAAKDTKEEVVSKAKSEKEKVEDASADTKDALKDSVEKAGAFFNDMGDKVKGGAQDTKETITDAKDKTAEKIKESLSDAKDVAKVSAEKAEVAFSEVEEKIKDAAIDTKESAITARDSASQIVTDTVSDARDAAKIAADKASTAISDTGDKIKEVAKDSKDSVVPAKAAEEVKDSIVSAKDKVTEEIKTAPSEVNNAAKDVSEKTGGFFSGLGKKIKGTAKDTKEEVVSKAKSGKVEIEITAANTKDALKVSAGKTEAFISDTGDKIKDKSQEVKETVIEAKDKTAEKIKESLSDGEAVAKDSVEKAGAAFSDTGDKIKDAAIGAKDSAIAAKDTASQIVEDTVSDAKYAAMDTADKTGAAFIDRGNKIKEFVKDTKDNTLSAGDKAVEKVKETASDTKVAAKDAVEKTGGFFSGLGKKIKGAAKDTKEGVVSKAKLGKEQVEDVAIDAKDVLKDSAKKTDALFDDIGDKIKDKSQKTKETVTDAKDKTTENIKESLADAKDVATDSVEKAGGIFSDVGDKIKDAAKETKESTISAKDSVSQIVTDKVSDARDVAKDAIDKTGTAISGTGDKINDVAIHTKDSVLSAGDKATEKVKDTALEAKESAKVTAEKAGGFFSGLGKKMKGAVKDTKEEVVSKAKSGKEIVEDVAADTKDTLEESAEKTGIYFSNVGNKVKGKAQDAKDTITDARDKTTENIKESLSDAKDVAKASSEKAEVAISTVEDKIKDTAKDTKESAVAGMDNAGQIIKDTVSDGSKGAVDKTDAVISDTGDRIKEAVEDTKDSVVSAGNKTVEKVKDTASDAKESVKDVIEKSGGFFSGLGKKIKGATKDTKEEVVSKAKSGKEKLEDTAVNTQDALKDSTETTGAFFSDMGDQIKERAKDTKESVTDAKDRTSDIIKQSVLDAKDNVKDSVEKAGTAISDVGGKVNDLVKETEDSAITTKDSARQVVKDTISGARDVGKDAADKTGAAVSYTGDKIKETAKGTKDSALSAADKTAEKVKDTALDTKETAKDAVEKTGGLFSGLGKKMKGAAKDTKKEVVLKTKSEKEKVEDAVIDTKDVLKDSAEKTGALFGYMGGKIKDTAQDATETVIDVKDKNIEEIKKSLSGAKEITKVSAEKAEVAISDVGDKTGTVISHSGDKIKEFAKDTKDSVISAGDTAAVKVKDTASDTKEAAKDAVKKTGGFFSGLGNKMKGAAKDTKEEVVSKAKSDKNKMEDTTADTKDALKDSAEKTGIFFSGKALDTKETITSAKDKTTGIIKETLLDVKDVAKDSADKVETEFSNVEDKMNDAAKDIKESALAATDSANQIIKDTVSDARGSAEVAVDKTNSAISVTGDKIKGVAKDSKDSVAFTGGKAADKVKDAKDVAKETVEKTGGFLSGIGKKIKFAAKDSKEEVVSKTKSGKEQMDYIVADTKDVLRDSVKKTDAFIDNMGSEMNDKAQSAKETISDGKDKTAEKIIECYSDTKDVFKDSTKKAGVTFSDAGDKIKDAVSDAGEATKSAADQTGAAVSISGDKIKEVAKDTKSGIMYAGEKASKNVKDSASNVTEAAKDAADKTDGFFSGLGKKIKDTAKDTKEEVVSKAKLGKEKVEVATDDSQDALQDLAEKSDAFFRDVGDKIKDKAHDANATVTDAKDKAAETISQSFVDVKDDAESSTMKAEAAIFHIGEKIKDVSKDSKGKAITAKDNASQVVRDTVSDTRDTVKDVAVKTGATIRDTGDNLKEITKDTKDSMVSTGDKVSEKVKGTASDAKEVVEDVAEKSGGFFSGLRKKIKGAAEDTKEEVEDIAVDTKGVLKDSVEITGAFFSDVGDKVKDKTEDAEATISDGKYRSAEKLKESFSDAKDVVKDSAEKAGTTIFKVGDKFKDAAKETKDRAIAAKDSASQIIKDTVSGARDVGKDTTNKTGAAISYTGDKIKEVAKDTKDSFLVSGDKTTESVKSTALDAKESAKDAIEETSGFFSGVGKKIKSTTKDTKDGVVSKAVTGKEKVEEAVMDTNDVVIDSAEKTGIFFSDMGDKIKDTAHDAKVTVTKVKDKTAGKINESLSDAKHVTKDSAAKADAAISDVGDKIEDASKGVISGDRDDFDKTGAAISNAGDKIKDIAKGTKDSVLASQQSAAEADTKEVAKIIVEQTGASLSGLGKKIKGDGKLTISMNDNLKETDNTDFVCYVTTPTMQRKGIGGSQRLSNLERPALIDVSNMPIDISSDEDDYIVTEPTEGKNVYTDTDDNDRNSPFIIENVVENEEHKIKQEHDKLCTDDKRRPLFHIGSKDEEFREEESSDWDDKNDKHIHSEEKITKSDTKSTEHEAQSDIDLIENKLAELGKALDDLEKVNIELEPQNENDEKNERKLRRVERRFERMASETIEKDIKEAKDSKLTSPEIEAKQDEDFRKMVSQLSQEEVSECQRLYSTLWDDITFTPSEEWDSKTPDSQPDEIQELPQGEVVEVVYMGPVTLNKDHLINKAGIEVDVIPIKRSPCTSPLPNKKLQNKGRARSAMGFYKERQVEERGSLPDLQNAGKSDDVKLDIQKGSIMSAILKVQPTILKEISPNVSTSSLYFNTFGSDDQFGRRKSTESLAKGTVVSAVKEWMTKSTPFGSTDNVRNTDAISLADTTISIFDDDDNDSVDLLSDSACQLESESSKSDIPDIHIISDNNVPVLNIYDTLKFYDTKASENDARNSASVQVRRVLYNFDQFPVGETSGGPLTNITTEGSTHLTYLDTSTELTTETPKPKPRIDKTPDSSKPETTQIHGETISSKQVISEVVAEDVAYSDRKKFWESVASKKEDDKTETTAVKKRMSLYEEQIYKQLSQENITAKKRTSVHDIGMMPPVPKPRSTLAQISGEEESQKPDANNLIEKKETIVEKSETLVSEYRAAFKDPNIIPEQTVKQEIDTSTTAKSEKSESIDSEVEYLKYEHQAYENPGYLSDDQETKQKISEKQDTVPQIKRRQMSVSQPPVAAVRKTVFERSVSLPSEDLQDVSEKSVKARKQFFEQQLKKEMVIDQLMTQLEEEELQEYKTLPSTEDLPKIISPEEKLKIDSIISSVKVTEKEIEKDFKEIEKKLSPISSSSSQDTKTEDDITQYTPTSVKDLTRYFQPNLTADCAPKLPKDLEPMQVNIIDTEIYDNSQESLKQEIFDEDTFRIDREISKLKQSSTESEQSISSERSIELGSAEDLPSQIAEILQYKSDSISRPSDSLEVHVDKSEIEDSEKIIDNEQDATDIEVKSLSAEEYLSDFTENEPTIKEKINEEFVVSTQETKDISHESKDFDVQDEHEIKEVPQISVVSKEVIQDEQVELNKISPIREHKEEVADTVWEVSVESQLLNEIVESVTEIPLDRQIIVERDEELSGSVRDESDLGSEIHQDHSESYDSERARSESHSEVEQLILESLYHQKIHPEDARKIASELIDDIEAEIERRNLNMPAESDEAEPPVPHPEVAKNQISDYLRQLAESKGLDAKEVELVESVLARKQNELSKLGRHDTQTSSMEITDEDLKYSGGECDISSSESHENILEEQIEQLELENEVSDTKINIDEEKFSEKVSDSSAQDIHIEQDREIYEGESIVTLKTETIGKVETSMYDEKEFVKKSELVAQDQEIISKDIESKVEVKGNKEEINLQTEIQIKSDIKDHSESISTRVTDDKKEEHSEKITTEKKVTDTSEIEELLSEGADKKTVVLEGVQDSLAKTHEVTDTGFADTTVIKKTEIQGKIDEETGNKVKRKQETTITPDGTEVISEEINENVHSKTVTTSEFVDQKREERTSVTTFVQEILDEPITTIYEEPKQVLSDESKSSPYESAKSPEDLISSSSSVRKDDSDTSHVFDKPEVVFRKTKFYKEMDTSSSSGNLKTDRRSGADFEAYSSSGESHYHSFEQDSAKSRPCSSDVEGLMAAGSSEYESALTSQDLSSRSHITSTEYHTAVSSLSSRESMKSLDSESSGHMASVEVSEASETLVPSTFELEGDILDGAVSQLLEDEVVDTNEIIEPYDRDIPEHVIRGEFPMKDKKSSFDTISDSELHGESMDISEEDSTNDKPLSGEITSKMKRSQEMTFQPVPKAIIADSPQSEHALEMDERFGSSLEDGSVLSMSLSSQSDVTALRTIIEASRRDSDKLDGSMTMSGQNSMSASNMSLDKIQPLTTATDSSTSTGSHAPEPLSSVTLTTSTVDENGTQSVCTQVTSQTVSSSDEVYNGPTQVDYVPEYDDVVETKKIRGHRRQESTSTFVPSMIPGFTARSDVFKSTEHVLSESEKHTSVQLTLKEEHHEEMKDVDETEETEADRSLHREPKESLILERDSDQEEVISRPESRISKAESEDQKEISAVLSEDKPDSELLELMEQGSEDILNEPIERPLTPEPPEEFDIKGSVPSTPKSFSEGSEKHEILYERQMKMSISEKSSIEEGEAEAAFSMVAHISPAHKAKGIICPIMEDEDAEKHELETRERAQKEMERRRAQIREQSPGSIPDIMVTEHMTPLVDREFHYPDLELEEKEALARSAPQTPGSITSRSSEETDQGREYVLEDPSTSQVIPEEPEPEETVEDKHIIDSKSDVSHSTTAEEKTVYETETQEPASATESPNSDSFEMLEKPDIIDDFVVIEEVAKEAAEHDTEGKSVQIKQIKYIRKHDEEVEEYLVKSAPTPLTRMTDLKYYPDGNSGDELGPFDFEDSPPQAGKKSTGTKTQEVSSRSYAYEYDKELEASKKWIEMQFQGDQAALINAGYGYEMEFERGPLEDIKEEEATDFESSRIGSLDSQKHSIGSLGSVKDSFSSTPEYDVLAGRKFFTRSGEHDDVSMSSLQEFEHLERVISLENRRHHQGSQDSSSNGSFSKRYHASRSGQGDDVSLSSLKEFEGLETACIEAHKIEVKAKEEEALLAQIDEAQENLISESESCKSVSSADKKNLLESEEEDYEKRMFEIDEIIKQAQSNVEKFIDMKDMVDKTESMGRGDSLEEVAKVPDLELDEPIIRSSVHTVKWGDEDVMQTSTDSLDLKPSHHESTDSLDIKPGAADPMTTSTDSIEYQIQAKSDRGMIQSDSIEMQDPDRSCMITSDSLELTPSVLAQSAPMSDSIDEDGSRIGEPIAHDQSSSSGFSIKDENIDVEIKDQRAEFLLGSTDSLDPSSSTATHATYQYETDSVMSGSFTSGGSNTMVSSTDTIDPLCGQAHGVDIAAAVRKVWFDEDSFGTGTHFTTELLDDGSKPFVTEVIEPCEGDPEYSHTIHRKMELPAEIKKITFKGPDADLQLRQYIENFGEGEDVEESQEVDKDGNIHVKRVVQKRFIVKADPSGEEKRISGPDLESYLQQVSSLNRDEFDLNYKDPSEFGLTKQTRTDSDGTKTIYGQKFTAQYVEGQGEESSLKQLLSSIASDVTESSTYSENKLTRHVDNQQESATGSATATFSGAAAANVLRAQGSRRKPLRFDISVDDQTEVDPREHDWRFILPRHDEHTTSDEKPDSGNSKQTTQQQKDVADQHQLSTEMKELLEEMEKHSKQ